MFIFQRPAYAGRSVLIKTFGVIGTTLDKFRKVIKIVGDVKSPKFGFPVIPANAGIQYLQ